MHVHVSCIINFIRMNNRLSQQDIPDTNFLPIYASKSVPLCAEHSRDSRLIPNCVISSPEKLITPIHLSRYFSCEMMKFCLRRHVVFFYFDIFRDRFLEKVREHLLHLHLLSCIFTSISPRPRVAK